MLEGLKQLQVKPRSPSVQANICNQKIAGDCGFLGSFTHPRHVGSLSYRQTGRDASASHCGADLNVPAFSPKTLQGLEVSGIYWPNIQPFCALGANARQVREAGPSYPESSKTTILGLKIVA
jgi:hypothetical protein